MDLSFGNCFVKSAFMPRVIRRMLIGSIGIRWRPDQCLARVCITVAWCRKSHWPKIEIQTLSCEHGIIELMKVILNCIKDLNDHTWLMPDSTNILWGRLHKIQQPDHEPLVCLEMNMFASCLVSTSTVRLYLQQRGFATTWTITVVSLGNAA